MARYLELLKLAALIEPFFVAASENRTSSLYQWGTGGGVSGAGRHPKLETHFCEVNENLKAYGVLKHRHTPEMEQVLDATVLFTPHLAPMNRGILATCYARPSGATSKLRDDETSMPPSNNWMGVPERNAGRVSIGTAIIRLPDR